MNETMFAAMADQMRPDADVLAGLLAQLDAEPGAGSVPPRPAMPPRPAPRPVARRRIPPARWWIGIAAAGAAVALLLPAVGNWPAAERGVGAGGGGVETASGLDYAALYRMAAAAVARQDRFRGEAGSAVEDTAGLGAPKAPVPQAAAGTWQTNTQVAGIDEGDIVKSDGRSIFVASDSKVAIMAADGSRTRRLATIDTSTGPAKPGTDSYTLQGPVVDLELQGSTLVVIVTEYQARTSNLPSILPGPATSTMVPFDAALTKALLYDVADPSSPRFLASLGQSGGLVTTRLAGDLLYVVTNYTLGDAKSLSPGDPKTFVPVLTEGDRTQATKVGDIGMLPEPSGATYTVVSSIDVSARKRVDTQSVLGGTGTVFMATDNLYLAAQDWEPSAKELARAGAKDLKYASVTQLARVAIAGGELSLAAQGVVPGAVLNQFALDEYQGNLRVVTSLEGENKKGWVQRAGLFVLDAKLKPVGSISSLVTGESVRSVRFAGPVGYVVTFRQVDPLFAVDLSDAAKPRVLSALKIPGFSTYLHPWSDTQLLGLGRDVTAKGEDRGLKLSMFDITDPVNVTETTVAKVSGDDAEALSDHRAVLVDTADGLIGFAVADWGKEKLKMTYQTFRYEAGTGFVLVKKLPVVVETDGNVPNVRGLVIGDCLYVASARGVSAYSTSGYAKVADVTVKG